MESNLRDLFHKPQVKEAGGISFAFYKIGFDQFADAIALGEWLRTGAFSIDKLRDAAKPGSPQRELLLKLVAGCMKLAPQSLAEPANPVATPAEPDFLQPSDVAQMPVPMLAEAVMVVLEENADFFTQTLPRLTETMIRLGSIGSALLNSSSAPATVPSASPVTP